MKIFDATIDIRPRTSGEIVDLAVLFYRKHFVLLSSLMAILGFPLVLLCVAIQHLFDAPWLTICVFIWLISLSSGAIVLAASRIVFGSLLSVVNVLGIYKENWARYLGRKLWENFLCILFSPILLGYAWHLLFSYTAPVGLLEQLKGKDLRVRRKGLFRRGGGNSLVFDVLLMLVVVVFVAGGVSILELMLGTVFTLWEESGLRTLEVFDDPIRLGIWLSAVVIVYPLYSLGWFFRYLDARIRAEGWDLELDFRRTAQRFNHKEGKRA